MKEHMFFILVFFVMLGVLVSPYLVRYVKNEPLIFGNEPYYHLRMAETLRNTGIPKIDPLLIVPTGYSPEFYHIILSTMFLFVDPVYGSILLPILLGIACFIIFSMLLKSMGIPLTQRVTCLLILSISPPFILTFARSSPNAFAVFLNLLGAYLITRQDKNLKILSILVFSLLPFFGLSHVMIALFFIVLAHKSDSHFDFLVLLSVLAVSVTLAFIKPPSISIHLMPISSYFSDLGGLYGIGVWNAALSVIGLAFVWGKKAIFNRFYVFSAVVFVLALLNDKIVIYLMLGLALLCSYAVIGLFTMRWHLSQVRFLMILLVCCGILFSTLSYLSLLGNYGPAPALDNSLNWLRHEPVTGVLTHPSRGFWVQGIAYKPVLADGVHDSQKALNDTFVLLNSRNLVVTKNLLSKYNISHILVDSEMKNGLVWNSPDEGIMFLLGNNETFKRVYDQSGILMWQVIG